MNLKCVPCRERVQDFSGNGRCQRKRSDQFNICAWSQKRLMLRHMNHWEERLIWVEMTVSSETKPTCLLSQIFFSGWKNSLGVLVMFGFLLKSIQKTCKLLPGLSVQVHWQAVQLWEWALLELMISNEKKHRHRHPPQPKKHWPTTSAPLHVQSLGHVVCCACCSVSSGTANMIGNSQIKILLRFNRDEIRDHLLFYFKKIKKISHFQIVLGNINRFWGFKKKKTTEQKTVLLTWVMFFGICNELKLLVAFPSRKE